VSRPSRQCGILNISQPYKPPRPVTGIALLFCTLLYIPNNGAHDQRLWNLAISGYTLNQGSFLHVTQSGDIVLDRKRTKDPVQKGQRRLSAEANNTATQPQVVQRQGLREMCRDVIGKSDTVCLCLYHVLSEQKHRM
jgi:hypothetical protein